MTEVIVVNKHDRLLIDFFESHKGLLAAYDLQAGYSGNHLNIRDDDLHLLQDGRTVAVIRPESPHVITLKVVGGECDQCDQEILLSKLKALLTAFQSEIPVLIEID